MITVFPSWLSNTGAWNVGVNTSPITVAFTDNAVDATAQTTYTWSAKNFAIGTADSTRLVVADICSRVGGTTADISSVTIGGVSATLIGSARTTAASAVTMITRWQALVTTGTTATVSATFNAAMSRACVMVFTVVGSNGTAPSSGAGTAATNTSAASASISTSAITVPTNGGAIVGGYLSSSTTGVTPTNYSTDLAATLIATSNYMSGGHDTTSGSRAYTMAWAGTSSPVVTIISSSWGP